MRKLIASLYTGYCGSDRHAAFTVDDDTTDEEINNIAYDMALEHADGYGYYPYPDNDDNDDDYDEYNDGYTYGIEGAWEDYVPEEHDRYRAGGGSFEVDF